MRVAMACEDASVRAAIIGDGCGPVCANYVGVEVHQPLPRNGCAVRPHSVSGVANRTGEASVDVERVLAETGVLNDLVSQVVTLAAQCIGAMDAEIGIRVKIRDRLSRSQRLTIEVFALENVRPLGSMRSVRTGASELAVVVAVVTIGA